MATMTLDDALKAQGVKVNYGPKQGLDKNEYYLLIGRDEIMSDSDEIRFITIPQPVGLNTMKKSTVYGIGEFQEDKLHGNDLLDLLLSAGKENLEPGESMELIEFKVRLYRKKANQADQHQKNTQKLEFRKLTV